MAKLKLIKQDADLVNDLIAKHSFIGEIKIFDYTNTSVPESERFNTLEKVTAYFGGRWEAWAGGRVPVGVGSNGESAYSTSGISGGSENSVASHTHAQNAHTHTQPAHTHRLWSSSGNIWSSNVISLSQSSNQARYIGAVQQGGTAGGAGYFKTSVDGAQWVENTTPSINSSTATNLSTGQTGGNRQPFITCYMWRRIA